MSFKKSRLGNMKYVLEIIYMISSVSERQEWTLQTPTEDCNDNNALFSRVQMSAFDTPSLYLLL